MLLGRNKTNPKWIAIASGIFAFAIAYMGGLEYLKYAEWKEVEASGAYREEALPILSMRTVRYKARRSCHVTIQPTGRSQVVELKIGALCTLNVGDRVEVLVPTDASKSPVFKQRPPQMPTASFAFAGVALLVCLASLVALWRERARSQNQK